MVCIMARYAASSDVAVQGLSTPLATTALLLAREVHNLSMVLLYTDGGHIVSACDGINAEIRLRNVPFAELVMELVPSHHPFEFLRPAQLDARGNGNNVEIRTGSGRTIPLPGPAGMCDTSSENHRLAFYVPRHDRRTLVPRVDVVSTPGRSLPAAIESGLPAVPTAVFTDLGTLALDDEGFLRLTGLHDRVTLEHARDSTGFELEPHPTLGVTELAPPMADELAALDALDPQRSRDLEMLPTQERLARLLSKF